MVDTADRCDPDASGPAGDTGAAQSVKTWTSDGINDYEGDGCRDSDEDTDDDNDGVADTTDRCDPDASGPAGDTGASASIKTWTSDASNDYEGDGCRDADEDTDDDNDGIADGSDRCDPDASGPAEDTGVVSSQKNWTSDLTSDYDVDGCRDSDEDLDDDNDTVVDTADRCDPDASGPAGDTGAVQSVKTWTSSGLTDYEGDGCRDSDEDLDDDNDGVADTTDQCDFSPLGFVSSSGTDHDADGCKDNDIEDDDDDNDGAHDGVDQCPVGVTGWISDSSNDYDVDGCQDANAEDNDDDNDTVVDVTDKCDPDNLGAGDPVTLSVKNWTPNGTTDHDGDGCKDDTPEDPDDDNDGILDDGGPAFCDNGGTTNCDDNCQYVANANQLDNDHDHAGDACDTDDDNDTVLDGVDNCPFASNTTQDNADGDTFGDACDTCTDVDLDGWGRAGQNSTCTTPNVTDCDDALGNLNDRDGDNICLPTDTCDDADHDGWGKAGANSGCLGKENVDDCNGDDPTTEDAQDIDRQHLPRFRYLHRRRPGPVGPRRLHGQRMRQRDGGRLQRHRREYRRPGSRQPVHHRLRVVLHDRTSRRLQGQLPVGAQR
ncbi:MAG: thrombospondin type 3 repeat-containing protein [Myxococcota bacterium]